MKTTIRNAILLVLSAIVCGCANGPEYFYADQRTPLKDVAVIRGVREKQSIWLAGVTAVFQAEVTSITDTSTGKVIAPYKARGVGTPLYVLPGTYLVRVSCTGGGFIIALDFPLIAAEAGSEYQLECVGGTAHNMKPRIRRVPNTSPGA